MSTLWDYMVHVSRRILVYVAWLTAAVVVLVFAGCLVLVVYGAFLVNLWLGLAMTTVAVPIVVVAIDELSCGIRRHSQVRRGVIRVTSSREVHRD